MKVDSLESLSAAFSEWRSQKTSSRERIPRDLIERARRMAGVHGATRVALALNLDYRHLQEKRAAVVAPPSYSKVEVVASPALARPIAELEMANGLKLRLYAQTQEMLSLLSALCTAGGGR